MRFKSAGLWGVWDLLRSAGPRDWRTAYAEKGRNGAREAGEYAATVVLNDDEMLQDAVRIFKGRTLEFNEYWAGTSSTRSLAQVGPPA